MRVFKNDGSGDYYVIDQDQTIKIHKGQITTLANGPHVPPTGYREVSRNTVSKTAKRAIQKILNRPQ